MAYSPPHTITPEWCQIPCLLMGSCIYIVYDLTYQKWLENSTQISSYGEITFRFHVLSSDSVILSHLWSQNAVITSWFRLTATSNCFPHPQKTYTMCLSTLICYPWAKGGSHTQLYPQYFAHIFGFWVTCGVKMMSLRHGWGWQSPQTTSHIHIGHIQSV